MIYTKSLNTFLKIHSYICTAAFRAWHQQVPRPQPNNIPLKFFRSESSSLAVDWQQVWNEVYFC